MAPVLEAMRVRLPDARNVLINTGQHYDALSTLFREALDMREPDHELEVGSVSQAVQTARVMERIEPVLIDEASQAIVVPGDVNSTLAASIVAVKLGIDLIHLESGLRSFDRTMPEEVNRVLVDQISDLLLVHSPEAVGNLTAEGVDESKIAMVGNTMIDALVAVRSKLEGVTAAADLGLEPGAYLLVTLHRPALVDGPLLGDAIEELAEIAKAITVVFPVHPRTKPKARRPRHNRGHASDRPGRLPRVPLARIDSEGRPDRFGRGAGGDDLPRCPLLHPARQHRAPCDHRARDQHPARPRPHSNRNHSSEAGRVGALRASPGDVGRQGGRAGRRCNRFPGSGGLRPVEGCMKQVTQRLRNGRIQLIEVPWPELNPNGVIVDVRASLFSVGTGWVNALHAVVRGLPFTPRSRMSRPTSVLVPR